MILLELFWSFFQVGLFCFGGGYAALPLIQRETVDLHHWLDLQEFADVVTISQMTPGPIGINAATFVGQRVASLPGSIVATLGFVFPSFLIVLVLAVIYYRYRSLTLMQSILGGLRPAVVALIASAGLTILIYAFWGGRPVSFRPADLDLVSIGLFIASIVALQFKKSNPVLVMLGAGLVGLLVYSLI
jgi:chromate transporter